jgi:nucleoid-associated protein YgaU
VIRRRAVLAHVVAASVLVVLGSMPVPVPSHLAWDEIDRWYLDVGPAVAAIASLRFAAQVAAGWLAIVSGLHVVAAGGGWERVGALADRLSPRFLRSVASGAAALSLGVGLGGPAAAGGPPPSTAVMVPLDGAVTTSPSTSTVLGSTSAAPTSTPSTSPTTTTTATPPRDRVTAPTPRVAAPDPPASAPAHDEVFVEPGGSFWSIAEEEAGGRAVGPFWRALIELNRERLVDPSNPDLLYPGQVLRLPS